MTFVLQEPGKAKLLEAIAYCSRDADSGGGVFAFASRGGIEALFALPGILHMLRNGRVVRLVVGMDAITNAEALLSLADQLKRFPRCLTAQAFCHDHPASTFHPKFCWFRSRGELRLLTGSGNLTLYGLGASSTQALAPGNWEAFTQQILTGNDALAATREIDGWLDSQRQAGTLCAIDDERVKQKAMNNGRVRYVPAAGVTPPRTPAPHVRRAAVRLAVVEPRDDVLIREIPSNRSGQADVGQTALQFFGYEGVAKNVLIQHVSERNELGPVIEIRLFVNASRNFRLELRGIADLPYDVARDDGRMLLIATKLDGSSFRYTIVPVNSPAHARLAALIGPVPPRRGRSRPMRQLLTTVQVLAQIWPEAPSNLLPVNLPMGEP